VAGDGNAYLPYLYQQSTVTSNSGQTNSSVVSNLVVLRVSPDGPYGKFNLPTLTGGYTTNDSGGPTTCTGQLLDPGTVSLSVITNADTGATVFASGSFPSFCTLGARRHSAATAEPDDLCHAIRAWLPEQSSACGQREWDGHLVCPHPPARGWQLHWQRFAGQCRRHRTRWKYRLAAGPAQRHASFKAAACWHCSIPKHRRQSPKSTVKACMRTDDLVRARYEVYGSVAISTSIPRSPNCMTCGATLTNSITSTPANNPWRWP